MIGVTGLNTTIVRALAKLSGDVMVRINIDKPLPNTDLFVLAAGVMHGMPIGMLSAEEMAECFEVNFFTPILWCESILATRPAARIVVIGSESVYHGSFDEAYVASKAALHAYVMSRHVGAGQLLACISPPIISDSGMTRRRHDYPAVLAQRRTVSALDVARIVHTVLTEPACYPPGRHFIERMMR